MKKILLALVIVTAAFLPFADNSVAFAAHGECVSNASSTTGYAIHESNPPVPCSPQCPLPPCPGTVSPTDTDTFMSTIQTVFNVVFGLLVIIASFFLLFAAFEYITARGEHEKIVKAKDTIVYAIVALVVAIFAWGLPKVIIGFFGVQQ